MTKRHRSFGVKKREELPEDEIITFDIDGEDFTARPDIPGAVILDFVAAADAGPGKAAAKIMEFFERALDQENHKRFEAKVNDPDVIVEMETLSDIVAYLIEEYTSRPTGASE